VPDYSLTHLADSRLAQELRSGVTEDRLGLAKRLAQLAEFDHRRLYLPTYPSMYQFCLQELKYSEDEACKRIHVARAARRFPAVFEAIANGRQSLSTVDMLVPCLLPETVTDLLSTSAGMTKAEVARLLAERFPQPDLPTVVIPVAAARVGVPSPEVTAGGLLESGDAQAPSVPERIVPIEPMPIEQRVVPVSAHTRVVPLTPERYAIQVSISKATHDRLRQAQALLSHAIPSGDVAEVIDRALAALITQLEKRMYGATDRPSAKPRKASRNPRHIPAHVRRAVRRRDVDQCTFVDDKGRRCREHRLLQFDHVVPVARGGESTVSNLRLRCAAHNQYEADRAYGAGFMSHKRSSARDSTTGSLSVDPPPRAPGP
jgi:hypothetical protein